MTGTVPTLAFWGLALLTIAGAAGVALSGHMVRSAFSLFAALFGMAGIYALLQADLMAVVQLLVYVGGISVLVLFAVMLTSGIGRVGTDNPSHRPIGGLLVLLAVLIPALGLAFRMPLGIESPADPTVAPIGDALLGRFVLPFEVVSVLLLAALVGAVNLARGWRRDPEERPSEEGR
ncbi:MAG TPA: NADH-quinone oxidoreductase subunit J [Myxococcota bacterium]|nr:NADH-quinone oxidoreductase subunit J [Myxococcota bacterium]HQK50903.1 NADH-quinone oxidoreductase subunit J [Myxococcota bacterium]